MQLAISFKNKTTSVHKLKRFRILLTLGDRGIEGNSAGKFFGEKLEKPQLRQSRVQQQTLSMKENEEETKGNKIGEGKEKGKN